MILSLKNTKEKTDCYTTLKLLMIKYKQSKLQTIQSATDYAMFWSLNTVFQRYSNTKKLSIEINCFLFLINYIVTCRFTEYSTWTTLNMNIKYEN